MDRAPLTVIGPLGVPQVAVKVVGHFAVVAGTVHTKFPLQ
jgi:hypothetical protein